MKIIFPLLIFSILISCKNSTEQKNSLKSERSTFKTKLITLNEEKLAVEVPPDSIFNIVNYNTENGAFPAYLTPAPKDNKKHPAIIWITGGDCNSIGEVWEETARDNDQTAAAYRNAGIIMMFPSLRGGNDNKGKREGFLGEVNDIIAAYNYIKTIPYVDTSLIFLGGHSTGGTMCLLTAELSECFTGIISFGPVGDVSAYGSYPEWLPYNTANKKESILRSPEYWLKDIKKPTWVIEGSEGNFGELIRMNMNSKNPNLLFIGVPSATHFGVLAPTNELIAKKIAALKTNEKLTLSKKEIIENYTKNKGQ